MTSTPNMNLLQPAPGSLGPQWAEDLNTNANTLDTHDHSSGKGIPITPSGMNINTDFSIQSFSLLDAKSVKFVNQTSSLAASGAQDIYIKNGDLFYANGGTDVQITNGGSVAGASGSISGLVSPASCVFSGQQFSFFYDAGTYADLRCRDLTLSTNGGSTLKITQAVSATYTLTLPASPPATSTQLVTMSTTGTLSAPASPTLGTTASVLTWQGTTNATSPTTGSIVTAGGLGVAKDIWAAGSLITNSNAYIQGPLTVASSGASITGGLAVTGNSVVTGNLSATGSLTAGTTVIAPNGVRIDGYTIKTRIIEGLISSSSLNAAHGLPSNAVVTGVTGLVSVSSIAVGGYDMAAAPGLGFNGLQVTDTLVIGINTNSSALGSFYRVTLTYFLR